MSTRPKIINFTKISAYQNVRDRGNIAIGIGEELYRIQSGEYKNLIDKIRSTGSKEIKQKLKLQLPLVSWGGIFNQRVSLTSPSGFACMDFDHVDNTRDVKERLKQSLYVYACWISPSGEGVKALIRIPEVVNKKQYREHYLALLQHYRKSNPDPATKDINRLCFTSYDPELYVNDTAVVFTRRIRIKTSVIAEGTTNDLPEAQTIQRLFMWWKRKFNYGPGCRNQALYVLCATFSEFGVSEETALNFAANFQELDFPIREINMLVKSAYKRTGFNIKSFE